MWGDDRIVFYREAACRFLREREFGCVRASENLQLYLSNPELQSFFSVYIHLPEAGPRDRIDGLAVVDSDGVLCVLLPDSPRRDSELAGRLRLRRDLYRISGVERDVRRLVAALGEGEWQDQSYMLMRARSVDIAFPPKNARVAVRNAGPDDLDALLSLQMAYEREELNLKSTRSETALKVQSLLERQIVAIAFRGDEPIGKINTNARGYFYDQIGGFYVKPEYRSMGIGAAVLFYLLYRIKAERRDPVLFVRHENVPAIKVYRRAGFRPAGEYGMSTKGTRRLS